ncbi:N-acetyltransferase ESCO2 [Diorhabda carinulata]|uniref:N-acetyltransferase ESCO2 n=1 Tax=Diorhabda carinulata TaxID=1163345 RepID=UPI0025A13FE9|nr:N-acetyltransferase ESCO2 [Diorhabda carinulata]
MNLKHVTEESSYFNNSHPSSNRRRSLFPSEITDSESDSDLGHISPLNFDTSFELGDFTPLASKQSKNDEEFEDTVGEYDILGILQTDDSQEAVPPLYLSPLYRKAHLSETPQTSPTSIKLKTPHDSSNTNTKLPKLSRKSLLDSSEVPSKRKISPDNSPEQSKQIKLDPKSSRVRTTLFPEVDFALPTTLFYPKTESMDKSTEKKRDVSRSSVVFTKNQKIRSRKKIGQINAGVHHKIKRPKPKKLHKTRSVQKKLSVSECNAISDYIESLKQVQNSALAPKLIENKENNVPEVLQFRQITPANDLSKQITTAEIKDSRKRALSPDPVPDPSRKFFKFSRGKGVVKMNKSLQLEMDHGKLSLINKNKQKNQNRINSFNLNCSDDLIEDESETLNTNIEEIICSLEEESVPEKNTIVLQAHNSVIASENSILLHQPNNAADLILSPISHMCDVTSGLALNSPKRCRNLNPILDGINNTSNLEKNDKLFPVFYPQTAKLKPKNTEKTVNADKKLKKLPPSQMLLDAGQKKFGMTQCNECNIVYHMGDPNDEMMHLNYHTAQHVLRFPGWKKERIVLNLQDDSRIIHIVPGDSKIWWKKVGDLMEIINREMGCYNMDFSLDNCQAFLYIKKKIIVGCLVATSKSEGYKLLSPIESEVDVCSEEKYPIKCGVPRIWVSVNNRKQGIATKMMDVLRRNFIFGYTLDNFDIAFSSPTDDGKIFAQIYFGTNNFYIY